MKKAAIAAIVFLLVTAHPAYSLDPQGTSKEQQLALLDNGETAFRKPDDPLVQKYKTLLDSLAIKHEESRDDIANLTSKAQDVYGKKGMKVSHLAILEGMNASYDGSLGRVKYVELHAIYGMLREKNGDSHEQAVKTVRVFMNGLAKMAAEEDSTSSPKKKTRKK